MSTQEGTAARVVSAGLATTKGPSDPGRIAMLITRLKDMRQHAQTNVNRLEELNRRLMGHEVVCQESVDKAVDPVLPDMEELGKQVEQVSTFMSEIDVQIGKLEAL